MKKYLSLIVFFVFIFSPAAKSQIKSLSLLQQEFVDLRFGMFIHFNMATFMGEDWADPKASPSLFNPQRLDCNQWARTAKEANMTYGCLTTKHHSGFCIWDTKSTDYSVMRSPLRRDVVKEFTTAFRKQGLKVMLYYSILDTHHELYARQVTPKHIDMIKTQLTELLTNYGEIAALVIDGWDAPWSRISYDEVPFEDIYSLVKSIQPNCLLMDLNAAKYPSQALFYSDIKSYEQGAGQYISKENNTLPALSCLPINSSWFWKEDFPTTPVKDPAILVNDNIIPLNNVFCNFILNAAPNRDGLIDNNAVAVFRQIGKNWKNVGGLPKLPDADLPIISPNIAKFKPTNSSWSRDMFLMDFANDDNYKTGWESNKAVKQPWLEIDLSNEEQAFNLITVVEKDNKNDILVYRIEYLHHNKWRPIFSSTKKEVVKIHRFSRVWGNKLRITILESKATPTIAEIGVYNERR